MARAVRPVDPQGPVAAVARQLWGPLLDSGARVALGGPHPGWRAVEVYRAVPDAAHATMLLPDEPSLAAAAVAAYPGLRPRWVRAGRRLVALASSVGVVPGRDRVVLEVRDSEPDLRTPLALAAEAVGHPSARAAVGVRTGANAKATLQLFDPAPVGFAKLAWDEQSADFVSRERAVLARMGGVSGAVRVPRLLGEGTWGGFPYLVTEPLPEGVRRPRAGEGPTAAELADLAPVVRHDRAAATAQLAAVAERLAVADAPPALLTAARSLLGAVLADSRPVPVVAGWHGDLVPWNAARDREGRLWVWDWETFEPDVVLGLDAVHWALHAPTRTRPERLAARLVERLPALRGVFAAMGAPRHAVAVAVAVHALTLVDRGIGLAEARGGWETVHVGPDALRALVSAAAAETDGARH